MRYSRQLATFFLLLLVCSVFIILIYMDIETKTIAQVNSEQTVHASQAAGSISQYFISYNNTLSFLSRNSHIISLDMQGKELMKEFYISHAGDISSVTRVDENGTILYTYPFEGSSGADISDQAHVQKSMSTHLPVISDVFTSVQGFRTVAFSMPVFDNGMYRGSLSILMPFDNLVRKSVEPIHVLSTGHGWVISQGGTILYSPDNDTIGSSAYTTFSSSSSVLQFLDDIQDMDEGRSSYTTAYLSATETAVLYDAAYKTVNIGDAHWVIIVATPRDEILGTLQAFRRDLSVVFVVLLASLFFFTYYGVRARGIIKEEEKRREAEDALRESERKYRAIIENMQDIYYRTDRNDIIVMVSPSGIHNLGYHDLNEVIGKPSRLFFAYQEDYEEVVRQIKAKGSVRNFEIRLKRNDGTVMTALSNSRAHTDPEGNFLGSEGIIRDISDRKRAENALQLATRKLNLLTTITTTNIRNAAFSLSGYLELEKQERSEKKSREYHERERILLDQINRWLDIAYIYQTLGLHPPSWQNVKTVFLFAISHLPQAGIEHRIEPDNLEIYADMLLEKVFFNLAENVHVHAKNATSITITSKETAEGLLLIVGDNGPGIPQGMKAMIFQKEFNPARGMGLFMAQEILDITGISISETGTFGTGARFEILIPHGGYRFVNDGDKDTSPRA